MIFLSCKANARVLLRKTGHGPQLSISILISNACLAPYSVYCLCVILCTVYVFVLFCVPFMFMYYSVYCLCIILCTVYVYSVYCLCVILCTVYVFVCYSVYRLCLYIILCTVYVYSVCSITVTGCQPICSLLIIIFTRNFGVRPKY